MKNYLSRFLYGKVDRGSSVGIATRYGLDGPGSNPIGGAKYSAPFLFGPGAHPAPYIMGTVAFPGVKRPRRGVDRPPRSSAEVKNRIELYLYSPSEAFMVYCRVNFILPLIWEKDGKHLFTVLTVAIEYIMCGF
jgi:hypothetical protein